MKPEVGEVYECANGNVVEILMTNRDSFAPKFVNLPVLAINLENGETIGLNSDGVSPVNEKYNIVKKYVPKFKGVVTDVHYNKTENQLAWNHQKLYYDVVEHMHKTGKENMKIMFVEVK